MAKSRNWGRSANDENMGERRVGEQAPKERELHHEWGAKLRRAGRVAVTSALIYVFFSSSALAPFGMAISRAYATGEPLVNLTDSPAPETETEGDGQGDTPQEPGQNGAAPQEGNAGNSSDPDNDANPGSGNDPANEPAGEKKEGEDPKTEDPSGDQDGAATPDTDDNKKQDSTREDDPSSADTSKKDADDKAGQQADAPAAAPPAGDSVTGGGASQDGSADDGGESDDQKADDRQSFTPPQPAGTDTINANNIRPYLAVSGENVQQVNDNAYLVRRGAEPNLQVMFRTGSTTASYGGFEPNHRLTVELRVPYLYYDENDMIKTTYDRSEWLSKNGNDPDGMRLAVTPDLDQGWVYYDETGLSVGLEDLRDGLSGIIHAQYSGDKGDGKYSNQYNSSNPIQRVEFKGDVPENAGADISVGMTCNHYEENGKEYNGDFTIHADGVEEEFKGEPRVMTFINTNLNWEIKVEPVHQPVLWDRYNYLVNKITIRNTSGSTPPEITNFEMHIEADSGKSTDEKRILQKDIVAWAADQNGEVTGPADPNSSEQWLVGKPGEGGVLIYDVTKLTAEQLEALDTDRFSNVDTLLDGQPLKPLKYHSYQPGSISVPVAAPEGNLVWGGDNAERTYYVAMPYTSNIQGLNGQPPSVRQDYIGTVFFGQAGEYSWSEDISNNLEFGTPSTAFTQQKRARDFNTGALVEKAVGLLGWQGSYVIDGLSTKGSNVPVYGPLSDDINNEATGPYILDTIPEYYSLESFEFQIEKPVTRSGLPDPVLEDWFDKERGVIQIELEDGSWVGLDMPVSGPAEVELDGKTWLSWHVGALEGNPGTSVEDAIDAIEKDREQAWTRNVRILLRDELPADKDIPVRIAVNGILSSPTGGYTNKIVTHFGQRFWNTDTAEQKGFYSVKPHETTEDTAQYGPVTPVAPTIQTLGHTRLPGEQDHTFNDTRVQIPLNDGISGWQFKLGNTSQSYMQPARLATSPLEFQTVDGKRKGFDVQYVTLSAGLLKDTEVDKLTLYFDGGETKVLSGADLAAIAPDEDGNIILNKDERWPNKLLTHLELTFTSVKGELNSEEVWLDMAGQSSQVRDYPVTGTFETLYKGDFVNQNKSVKDAATLETMRAELAISTHGQYVDVNEVTNGAVPENSDGNQTQITVPYDRDFKLWADLRNKGISSLDDVDITFALPLMWETGIEQEDGTTDEAYTGFHSTKLTLTSEFLERWKTIGEIRFYDAKDTSKPTLVLKPNAQGVFEGKGVSYSSLDAEGNGGGDLIIDESAWYDGAPNLKAVKLYGWKGMALDDKQTDDPNQRIVFDGFMDAALGTESVLRARTINHVSGVRPDTEEDPLLQGAASGALANALAGFGMRANAMVDEMAPVSSVGDAWTAVCNDATTVYVSKMAFDASARAAYLDDVAAANGRFTSFTTPDDLGHRVDYGWSYGNQFDEGNKTLEIGYKAIGSYLFDFRQYTNAYNALMENATDQEQLDLWNSSTHKYAELVGAKSYNTEATLKVTQTLPNSYFDAYYIKLHPNALKFVKEIEVHYSDGTTHAATSDQWKDAAAIETDADGNPFVRIGLLSQDGLGMAEDDQISRDAFKDYGDDDFKDGVYQNRTVEKIVYTIDINQSQLDENGKAAAPDFGTWYNKDNPASASLEVTGRFFRDDKRSDEQVNAVSDVEILIGGESASSQREGAVAQTRYTNTKDGRGRSSWSYQDRSYHSSVYDYKMGHLSSTAKVDVSVDSHFVMKGAGDKPIIDRTASRKFIDGKSVAFGSDQQFSISYYREHVPYENRNFYEAKSRDYYYSYEDKRYGDDWGGARVAFADHVTVGDKLPVIDRGETDMAEVYGFLPTGIELVGQDVAAGKDNGLLDHMAGITFTTKKLSYDQASDEWKLVDADPIVLTAKQLEEYVLDNGSIFFDASPEGHKNAPEVDSAEKAYDLGLEKDRFVTEYAIELENLGGDADSSSEITKTYDGVRSGTSSDVDIRIFGRPYAYKDQRKTTDTDVLNTAFTTSATSYAPETSITSQDDGSHDGYGYYEMDSADDQAYFMGYLIPFGSEPFIDLANGTDHIFDYEADNNTPTTAAFEVRYKNNDDGAAENQKSARIQGVTLRVDMDQDLTDEQGMFRLRNLYIPEAFVGSNAGGSADWFQVAKVTFKNSGGASVERTLAQLEEAGYLKKDAASGCYVVDVETMLRNDKDFASFVTKYRGLDTTDTLPKEKGGTWDLEYTKAFVDQILLTFEAVSPDIDKDESVLSGGEYLSPDKTDGGYAFSYDGIYVDRTTDEWNSATGQDDNWSATSTPTFGKDGNSKGRDVEHSSRVFVEGTPVTIDPNHDDYNGTSFDFDSYYVSNQVAHADVEVVRGIEVEMQGGKTERYFAYDRDSKSLTNPTSDEPASGEANNIPSGKLMPGDYVEYTVNLGVKQGDDGRAIPLEYTQGRFSVAEGQRIVGWEVLDNTTGQEVTAEFLENNDEDGDGTQFERREAEPKKDYTLDMDVDAPSEQYEVNRNLVFSLGEFDQDDPDASQIAVDKGVKLRVITQMTDELQGDDTARKAYQDKKNEPFVEDEPTYESEKVQAAFVTITEPKHGYVQVRYQARGSVTQGGSIPVYYDEDVDYPFGYGTADYHVTTQTGSFAQTDLTVPAQFGLATSSNSSFYEHTDSDSKKTISIKGEFTEPSKANPNKMNHNDGSPAKLTVSGIQNPTRHTQDVMVSVSFMSRVKKGNTYKDYQGFELTKAPEIPYPDGIPASNLPDGRPEVLVEYWDALADNGQGAWVTEDKLTSQTLPTSAEEAAAVEEANRGEGVLGAIVDFFTPDAPDPIGPSERVRATESKFHSVQAIRWTYFDMPATADGTKPYLINDVELVGVGRFADTREITKETELNDMFGAEHVDMGFTHLHNEKGSVFGSADANDGKIEHEELRVKYDEQNMCELPVYRRTPILEFQTQTFQTGGQAAASWNPKATQKTGYVPGERFWYKDTLRNMPMGTNSGAPNLEGELINPVIFERIPSDYLVNVGGGEFVLDKNKVGLRWVDHDGNEVPGAAIAKIERVTGIDGVETGTVADYGGSMNYVSDPKDWASSNTWNDTSAKGYFSDTDPRSPGVSNSTTFDLYKITFCNGESQDGAPVVMNVGDQIEIWFEVQAAIDGLPQVYLDADKNLGTENDRSPAYFPRIGEYHSGREDGDYESVNPLNSSADVQEGFGPYRTDGVKGSSPIKVNNGGVLMDMDALLHDAAFSGDKPEQSDRWEAFDASYTYIPGSEINNITTTYQRGATGNNGRYLDMDSKTGVFQKARYTPREWDSSVEARNKLPKETWLVTPNATTTNKGQNSANNRDWHMYVSNPRTKGDDSNNQARWGHDAPLVWSESSLHMQKAWLASASDMQPDESNGYKHARAYESTDYSTTVYDPHYAPWYAGNAGENSTTYAAYVNRGVVLGKYAAALQYNQDFTSVLQAFNYGDRNLDGVEMLYVMPRGVEPKLPADHAPAAGEELDPAALGATAEVLQSVTGADGLASDPKVNEVYEDATDALSIEVIQTPYSDYMGFDAPSDPQDPGYYRDGSEPKQGVDDLSVDPSTSSYETKLSSTQDRTSEEYAESSQPWVFKITVKAPLGKWFGRNFDGAEFNTADEDQYTGDAGYKIRVNLPSHVFANNESGTWNDRLLVTPWESPDKMADPSPASSYFSVMDVDHYEGANAKPQNMNDLQVFGMDYMFTYDDLGATWNLLPTSPNMPSVNGYSVLNNSVYASGEDAGSAGKVDSDARDSVGYGIANKNGGTLWAQTGTRAVMREPFVRAWNTVGENGVTGDLDAYYLDADFDSEQLNVHVENRYWWDQYAILGSYGHPYEAAQHNYSTDGGQKGDLILPVVTTVLPENIVPVDEKGDPYPTDGKAHPFENWTLSTATADDYAKDTNALAGDTPEVRDNFDATVTYESVAGEDGAETKRYVVRFVAKDPASGWNSPEGNIEGGNEESRIPSGGMFTFKLRITTGGGPRYDKDHEETGRSYENVRTFVTSKLDGYRFVSDGDIAGNPYPVGQPGRSDRIYSYSNNGVEGDIRLDAPVSTYGHVTSGVLPHDVIDDGDDTVAGIKDNRLPGYASRYRELDDEGTTPNVEDYTFRKALNLTSELANRLDADGVNVDSDPFVRAATGEADSSNDDGLLATTKLRASAPRLIAEHAVEFEPDQDVPSVEDNDGDRPNAPSAKEGERIGRDGSKVVPDQNGDYPANEPLQYGDTPWYRATLKNDPGNLPAYGGAVLHGKLVFAVHLPRQVTFYDKEQMTDGNFSSDDAGRFYLEWTHYDRQLGKHVTEKLSPSDLVEQGWFVHVAEVPNWGSNSFEQEDYAKPDKDKPNDEGTDETAKPFDHEGETLVFEFAPPSDVTPEEFEKHDTLVSAMRSGIRANGYFGSGDVLTLRVKTRVDNVGSEDIEDLDTDWLAEESDFYATVHDLDGTDWPEGEEPGDDSWISEFVCPGSSLPAKPIYKKDSDNIFERPLAMQNIEMFLFENEVRDEAGNLLAPALDFDLDGDYSDVYTSATSGSFTIAKPKSMNRGDTEKYRVQVSNPDLGAGVADDARLSDGQQLLLTGAKNMGAAVNSFVVDWEVPYHGKSESSTEPPSLKDPPFDSEVREIKTGIWEIPGASMDEDASDEAKELAAYEQALRVYVLVRTEPHAGQDDGKAPEGGTIFDNVDYAKPGTSADRENYYDGSWRVVGDQQGYPVRRADGTKVNTTIDVTDPSTPGALGNEGVKQIRWVVKAASPNGARGLDAVQDDTGSNALPVPTGFRLDVDAAPDDPSERDTMGKQELDDIDPKRKNIGWTWRKDENGAYMRDDEGNPVLEVESKMPSTIVDNAAGACMHASVLKTTHVNHFIETPMRYDDTKFAPSDRSRVGYYRNAEDPFLAIDVDQYYFNGSGDNGYSWQGGPGAGSPSLKPGASIMMKYRVTLRNLSTEQIAELGRDEQGDTCTNPNISATLPFISALVPDDEHFQYVPYDQVKDNPSHVLNDGYKTKKTVRPDGVTVPAKNLDDETPRWTYYAYGDDIESNPDKPYLVSTSVGTDSVRQETKLGSDLKNNRQYLSLHFEGPRTSTGERRGVLEQGQNLVFEFMMPIRRDSASVPTGGLLDMVGYVHKQGNFTGYIPTQESGHESTAYAEDTRDSNLDGSTAQVLLQKSLSGLTFASATAFTDSKTSTTQLDTLFTKLVHGAASAPEGTGYTYTIRTANLSSESGSALNYQYPMAYDILPYEDDYEISNVDSDGNRVPRNSQWNGWIADLGAIKDGKPAADGSSPAIQLVVNDPLQTENFPNGVPIEGDMYEIWVGPFKKADGKIVPAGIDELPDLTRVGNDLSGWMQEHRDNVDDIMHKEAMVTLKELQQYVLEHPEEEEALRKGLRAIWCEVTDESIHLPARGSIEMRVAMQAPLNLPKYLGDTTKKAPTEGEKATPLYKRLEETVQWNSFFEYFHLDGEEGNSIFSGEQSQAGVIIDAPETRGYIGDYVWLDTDWSEKQDDTVLGAKAYEESKNGRKLLRGVREDGAAFGADGKLKDLDGDGTPDDPGINGVKVELLNEHGLPVNRDGEAAKWIEGIGADGKGLWVICDPVTGEPIIDSMGAMIVADAGEPFSFTTESDYYGNAGYYILSNLATKDDEGKQLKYRLRFTFPERYANYAVTTTEMGDGVKVEFETVAGDDGTERLVATTGNITPTPVKYDKDKFANGQPDPVHAAYDAAAVSHDLGIALPVTYEGVVYRDDLLEGGNASDPIDGYLDRQSDPSGADPNKTELPERRLANTTVSVHEFDVATQQMNPKPALDAYGQPATMTTDASGAFSFTLKPHRTYVLVSSVEGAIVKPTPYLWNPGPTDAPDDNDLYSLHGTTLTRPFAALPPVGADGAPSYVAPGDPSSGYTTQKVFALGYVDATLAFIGDTVWEDVNHDGIQQTDEPGISGVTVTLEQYWWDESANGGKGAWKLYEPEPTQTLTTNAAGTYVFKVKTALPKPGDPDDPDAPAEHALAGYRLRIDRDDLEKLGFPLVATHQNVGKDDELDSDVSRAYSDAATGADATGSAPRTQYLTPEDGQIVVANEFAAGESAAGQQAAGPDGKTYDLGSGKTVHDVDAGYVRVKTSAITGTVWADADRDGLQDTAGDNPAEAGMAGQQVVLEQYYLDGKTWVRNDAFGADAYTTGIVTGGTVDQADPGKVTVTTDADGAYRFDNLPIAYMAPGSEQPKLAGYRLTLGGLAADHTLARYHASMDDDPAFDTTRIDSDVYDVDLAIVDRESFDAKDNDAGSRPNDGQVILAAKAPSGASLAGATDPATKIAYDALEVDATELDDAGAPFKRGGDVGEVPLANASVSGLLWQDLDNDGIQDADAVWVDANDNGRTDDGEMLPEAGVPGIEVALTRYLANPDVPDGWEPDPTFGTDGRMTTVTDDQGEYRFDKLEGAQYDAATGKATVYAYRVELADHEAVSSSWHIARYQQGDDRAVDSDLMVDTGSMVDTDASEYLVLLEPATDETAQTNQAKAPASLPEDGQGLVTYDVTALVSNDTHDGGLLPRATRSIAGYLWHDADYDGLRDADELGLAQKEVTLHRWIYRDGAWEPFDMAPVVDPDEEIDPDFGVDPDAGAGDDPADPDVDPGMGFDPNDPSQIEPSEASVLTDDTGRFVFENEPVAVRVDGEEHLMGYTLTALGTDVESDVNHGVAGLPVTAVQVDSPAADAANSKARRPEVSGGDVEIAWDEKDSATEDRRTLDGRLVLATPKRDDSHEAYVVGDFDLSTGRGELRMNAGFGPFPTSSLTGIVWDDAHYDGLQQLEDPENPEHGMADVTVRITQWYQNEEGEFVQNEDFGDAENFALEAVTDEEGTYRFDDLPTYVQMATDPQTGDKRPTRPEERGDDDFRLAAYRVSLVDMPESYAVTRYHVGDDHRIDSDLRSDVAAKDLDIVEVYADETPEGTVLRGDGFAILAEPVANGGEPAYRSAYPSAYNDVTYDTLRALGVQRGGDAGLVRVDPEAAIEGLVWEDADGNGERALTERRIAGATVTLTRYMRVVGGAGDGWLFDDEFETLKVETKADGKYRFDGLASSAYRTIDNAMTRVLYGYRVNVTGIPEGYAVTKLNQGEDATRDSDLDMGTTRVLPDEALGGLTVLANEWQSDEDVAMKLDMGKLGTFTAAMSHDVAHLDAGLVPQDTTRVAGLVWEDANKDGLQTAGEYLRVGQKVMLDRRVMTKAELDAAGFGTTVADGAPGSSLDSEGEPLVAATPMPPELPWMDLEPAEPVEPETPEEPEGGEPVDPEAPEEDGDPGEGEGEEPETPEEPEAPEGDGSTDGEQPGTDDQGGQTDPDDGSAEEPQDGDGAGDDAGTEPALAKAAPAEGSTDEDDTQDLPRLEDDGILSDGDWEEIETTLTDLTGHYVFEDLPVADDEGRPYVYRVRMIKPDGAEYVPLNVDDGSETPDAFDNDYAHLNVLGALTPEEIGVTETLATVSAYEGGANAYGQPWDVSTGVAYSRDLGNSVDLGIFIPAPEPPVVDPDPDTPKPPVVDPDPDTPEPPAPTPGEPDPDEPGTVPSVPKPGIVDTILDALLPQTGDEFRLVRVIALGTAGIGLIAVALVLSKRRRKE